LVMFTDMIPFGPVPLLHIFKFNFNFNPTTNLYVLSGDLNLSCLFCPPV
jgi:hypothetical protein